MEWISVKDKLPKKGVEVLISLSVKNTYNNTWDQYHDIGVKRGRKLEVNESVAYEYPVNYSEAIYKITHWMTLPKVPKS